MTGFLLNELNGGPELLPAAFGLGVSDCTPTALWGPYFLSRVPVNDFNWAALAAFTGSIRNGFFENFSTKWIKVRSPQVGHYLPSSVSCMLIGYLLFFFALVESAKKWPPPLLPPVPLCHQ